MNTFNKRVSELLNRILVFAATYPHFFAGVPYPVSCVSRFGLNLPGSSGHQLCRRAGRSCSAGSRTDKSGDPPDRKHVYDDSNMIMEAAQLFLAANQLSLVIQQLVFVIPTRI